MTPASLPGDISQTREAQQGAGESGHLCDGGRIFIPLSFGCYILLCAVSTSKELYFVNKKQNKAAVNYSWIKKSQNLMGDLDSPCSTFRACDLGDGPDTR